MKIIFAKVMYCFIKIRFVKFDEILQLIFFHKRANFKFMTMS
jgi:hypothetical protein